MELFSETTQTQLDTPNSAIPLAARVRPVCLEDIVGQTHLLAKGKLLRRQIEADRVHSLVFYGPPGVGKTSLGEVIAKTTQKHFCLTNAVTSSVQEIKKNIDEARTRLRIRNQATLLFVDEIHRFNKAQQDVLLPHIENGTLLFMGATTHNPFFYINPTLLSRSQIFELKPLSVEEIKQILLKALHNKEKGLGKLQIQIKEEALNHLARSAQGDGRKGLNALEIAVKTTPALLNGSIHITLEIAEESIQRKQIRYDKDQDEHYDTISAFIKSLRGGAPDAALYWMAKMLQAGEDPRFIARRLIVAASEDVGNADPRALLIAVSALQAIECIGMPEGRIPLAQAVIYIATAPKSNSTILAIDEAISQIENGKILPVPDHLKDTHYSQAESMGRAKGYLYPHDFEGHYVKQDYLGEEITFYSPSNQGFEQLIQQRMNLWKEKKKSEKKSKNNSNA